MGRAAIVLTTCHLWASFFRVIGNETIRKAYLKRIAIGSTIVFTLVYSSFQVFALCVFIAVWWDVYHAASQTFGIGRLYSHKQTSRSRRRDYFFNVYVYAGAVALGPLGYFLFEKSIRFSNLFTLPANFYDPAIYTVFLGSVAIALLIYIWLEVKEQGKEFFKNWQRPFLFLVTGASILTCLSENNFVKALFILNGFHAVQYFAILAVSEKKAFRKATNPWFLFAGLFFFFSVFGLIDMWYSEDANFIYRLMLGISLVHFWMDGFIWSVRKKEVELK